MVTNQSASRFSKNFTYTLYASLCITDYKYVYVYMARPTWGGHSGARFTLCDNTVKLLIFLFLFLKLRVLFSYINN